MKNIYMGSASAAGFGLLALMLLLGFISIAERLFLAFAAYNDARSKGNPDATMWAILIGFFTWIPGIIYLCIRNSGHRFVVCQKCGFSHYAFDHNCPKCGEQNQELQSDNPYIGQQKHRAKIMMTVGLVLFGLKFVTIFISLLPFLSIFMRIW